MLGEEFSYTSENGYTGWLYDYHENFGKRYYQLSIRDRNKHEVLHAWNAAPKTLEELKKVVEGMSDLIASADEHLSRG